MKRWNLLDIFSVLFVILTILTIYFTLVHPVKFSHLIKREGVSRYAQVEILLPEDLRWMKAVVPTGEESRTVYGHTEWQILGFSEEVLGSEAHTKLTVKVLVVEESSGIIRYGKYTLVKGGRIILINDRYFIEGRIMDYKLLDEKILI